jgi:hypothetical protein
MVNRQTITLATTLGRLSCWSIGMGLILIGLIEAANCLAVCAASERQP